jgi:hypothetical protein
LPVAEFARALEAAGVVSDLDSIERIVIDLDPHDVVKVYVQRIAGPEIKQVAGLLGEMMRDGRAVNPDAPREHTPKHAAGCDLMLGHQVPDECQPSTEGPVT